MLLLAEIGDKMPTVTGTTVVACVIALISLGFGLVWNGSFIVAIAAVVGRNGGLGLVARGAPPWNQGHKRSPLFDSLPTFRAHLGSRASPRITAAMAPARIADEYEARDTYCQGGHQQKGHESLRSDVLQMQRIDSAPVDAGDY